MKIYNEKGVALATIELNPTSITAEKPNSAVGKELESWATKGVPGLRGEEKDNAIAEKLVLIPADDVLWGLAVLEAVENRRWKIG